MTNAFDKHVFDLRTVLDGGVAVSGGQQDGSAGGIAGSMGILGQLQGLFSKTDTGTWKPTGETGSATIMLNGKPTTVNTAATSSTTGFGAKIKSGAQVASTAYSIYSGVNDIANLYQFKGTGKPWSAAGRGALSGASAGSSLGPWGTLIGAVVGGTVGFIQGAKSKTEEERLQYNKTIASNINITNNKLDIVNRNLLAIKASIETYILPESSYFSEKNSAELQFSINSSRGFT
jgi:hypothetical protein